MRILASLFGLLTFSALAQQVGQPLPPWTAGTLDIHQINTGRGNSALLIFPDGTSCWSTRVTAVICPREAPRRSPTPRAARVSGSGGTYGTC